MPRSWKISSVRGCRPLARDAGEGPGAWSTMRTATPRRARSMARTRPLGPAPAISTSGLVIGGGWLTEREAGEDGAPERIRTSDLRLRRPSLYPLSYGRIRGCQKAVAQEGGGEVACLEGLEPPTRGLEGRCSIQLSYRQPGCCSVASLPGSNPIGDRISGRPDSNWGPPAPKAGALTRLRYAPPNASGKCTEAPPGCQSRRSPGSRLKKSCTLAQTILGLRPRRSRPLRDFSSRRLRPAAGSGRPPGSE